MGQKPQEMKRSEKQLDDKPVVCVCVCMHAHVHIMLHVPVHLVWDTGRGEGGGK